MQGGQQPRDLKPEEEDKEGEDEEKVSQTVARVRTLRSWAARRPLI